MASDGKQLEGLVAFVEGQLLPQGFEVKTNERVFNEDGVQVAEFDVEVRGKLGTTAIAWLIECRDRPAHGAAPGSWIEQLVGRRARFGFSRVTAVSTTGFAAGAVEFAKQANIELREVKALAPEEFEWLLLRHITQRVRHTNLTSVLLEVDEGLPLPLRDALLARLKDPSEHLRLLRATATGEIVSAQTAFHAAVEQYGDHFAGMEWNGPPKSISLNAVYPDDKDHFEVDTCEGSARIMSIRFQGEIRLKELHLGLVSTKDYRSAETGSLISQVAGFEPHRVMGMDFAFEFHKLAETGETHVIMRRLPVQTPPQATPPPLPPA